MAQAFALQPKRAVRAIVASSEVASIARKWFAPLWTRYVELKAPCVFIHIPKTAGTSIGNALGMPGIAHSTAEQWLAHLGEKRFYNRYRFTIVRHPIDRLISGRLWNEALSKEIKDRQAYDYGQPAFLDEIERVNELINDGLRKQIDDESFLRRIRMRPRLEIDGVIGLDYIGRFEEITEAFAEIAKHVPAKKDLPRLKSIDKKVKDEIVLERDVFDALVKALREDFDTFGYRPEDTTVRIKES